LGPIDADLHCVGSLQCPVQSSGSNQARTKIACLGCIFFNFKIVQNT